jgi:hypothetical protein
MNEEQTLENLAKELKPILQKYPRIMNNCGNRDQFMDFGIYGKILIKYDGIPLDSKIPYRFKLVIPKVTNIII